MFRKIPDELNGLFEVTEVKDKYFGKESGILEDYCNFFQYDIINDRILCKGTPTTKEKIFKLIDIFNYIHNLTNLYISKKKNIYEIIVDMCINIGIPKKHLIVENQNYYIDENYITACKNYFNKISKISYSKDIIKHINDNYKFFSVYYRIIPNPTLITKYKSIPCSNNIFSLYYLTLTILKFYSSNNNIKSPFICSECGGAFERKTNNQRYCDICKNKINFSKVSRNK